MTTLNAAANPTTRGLSLDFTSKQSTSITPDANAFASKLLDARQSCSKPDAASEATPALAIEPKRPVEKTKPSDKPDDKAADSVSAPKPKKAVKKSDDDRPVDPADESDENEAKADAGKPAVAKGSDDALLAALAAAATPAARTVAKPDEAKPADAKPADAAATPAVAAAAAVAANVAVQANAPASVDDQPVASADAKTQAVAASDAKDAKPVDAKLDALTAQLKPVEDKNAPLPPEATEQKGGGGKQHSSQQQRQQQASGDSSAAVAQSSDAPALQQAKADVKDASFDDVLAKLAATSAAPTQDATPTPAPVATSEAPLRPEQQFAKDNVDKIVGSVQTQATGGGNGTMNVRLTPPELGPLDVAAKMLDGKMSVAFTTSNEQATQLLSHSLGHLKTSLESAGITVDRIEVRQAASTSTNASSDRDASGQRQQPGRGFESASQQQGEQQRKQMVQKLWRKYAYGSDEVDLVA